MRRSEFTIVATTLFGVALLLWTALAPTDLDALAPPPAPTRGPLSIAANALAAVTFSPIPLGLTLVAGWWAARRRFHALSGATVLSVAFAAALPVLLAYYSADPDTPWRALSIGTAYPSDRLAAVAALGLSVVTTATTIRSRRTTIALWSIAAVALGGAVAGAELVRGSAAPTDLVGGALAGLFAASLANLLADVHVLRGPALARGSGRTAVIYNPAKVRDLAVLRRAVGDHLAEHGWRPPRWLATAVDDPGIGMAERALQSGAELILVAGGDGTVRTVCGALAGSGVRVALLPAGTGNLLARNLGVPLDLPRALSLATAGTPTPVDLLRVTNLDDATSTHAAVMTGLGADAAVLNDADEVLKKQLGPMAYVLAGLPHIRATPLRTTVTVDDQAPIERDASLVEVGNVGDLQAGVSLMPAADASDGLLDVLVASPRHVGDVAQMMAGVLLHSTREPLLDRLTGRRVAIEVERPVLFQIDGDVVGEVQRLEIEVVPGAVRLMLPAP